MTLTRLQFYTLHWKVKTWKTGKVVEYEEWLLSMRGLSRKIQKLKETHDSQARNVLLSVEVEKCF